MIKLLDGYYITADKRSFSLCHRADGDDTVCGYFATIGAAVRWMRRELQLDMAGSDRLTLKQAADRIEELDQRILQLLGKARLDSLAEGGHDNEYQQHERDRDTRKNPEAPRRGAEQERGVRGDGDSGNRNTVKGRKA